ncbi:MULTISPECIES: hypothetical protein [unclassified Breznakia]|uniref:ABC transporter permease n=1 Tax=unclassified Breznakia TaxID=2623764 RepID=UPI0024737E6A|nr:MULTISPECIES: hypothetical protein [unclassified Breznakia]MDH6366788.1 ribose transport system permease protein [Breznakia sp. PH1-1]MDH6403825.1 ribose transport system permease protein [Breznakia sp. PF1-11]MDH6411534.1 ribose transport system permease protein [Breznakia sp. PFB1-11]MDH6413898.1 ribose transport system permease protein [Breznakia sp. PFB1-14]MDH6416327.1 ribose transport system permease protein [Breznakia sp. PFB1-4]
MKKHSNNWVGNTVKTLFIPIFTALLFVIICEANGLHLVETQGHVLTLIRSTVVIGCTSWALALNLNSGRFDFSIGSIALLSSMISAKLVIMFDLPVIAMLVIGVILGGILGCISGVLYVLLKLPPIITSLGVTLIYEAFTFVVTNGEGLLISTNLNLLEISTIPWLTAIGIVGLTSIYILMNKTTFGYNHKALQYGQKISNNTGINETKNAILSYTFAGLLMGAVGCINLTTKGTASVSINFSSISTMFVAFLPLFIGGFIGRFSEERIGIFLGAITSALITLGFVRLDVSSQMQSLVNAVILLLFLVYLNNEQKLVQLFRGRK